MKDEYYKAKFCPRKLYRNLLEQRLWLKKAAYSKNLQIILDFNAYLCDLKSEKYFNKRVIYYVVNCFSSYSKFSLWESIPEELLIIWQMGIILVLEITLWYDHERTISIQIGLPIEGIGVSKSKCQEFPKDTTCWPFCHLNVLYHFNARDFALTK